MLAKLIVIIVAAGATACALLVNRQHRIDTAHEITVIHHRLLHQEQTLWQLRSDVANRTQPGRIRRKVHEMGGAWAAIPATPSQAATRPAALAAASHHAVQGF